MKTRKFKMKKSVISGIAIAAFAATALTASPLITHTAFADGHEVINGNYFISDFDTRAEVIEEGKVVANELIAEGTVLLKNQMPDGSAALPLVDEKNISCFGKSYNLSTAMTRAGYNVNPDLRAFYNNNSLSGSGAPSQGSSGTVLNGLPTGESDISLFVDSNDSISRYNDAAIVGFSRVGGEGVDLPRTMMQVDGDYKKFGANIAPVSGARALDDHYLQLDANEAALLKYCGEHFDKVIVVVDSPTPIEFGFLDDPDHYAYSENIVAALWTDTDGGMDVSATIADIITGKINPSGHMPDTLVRDFKADPTWNNFGNNFMEDYADSSGNTLFVKGNQYANDNMHGSEGNGGGGYYSNYVYFKEGIYTGYRYWETRGYTEGDTQWTGTETDTLSHYAHTANEAIHYYSKTGSDKSKQEELDGKTWDNWYDAHVVYPFGHGLSYTDFSWKLDGITETPNVNGKITANVTVKNTGSVAGKDVVQLYYSAPYIDGQIEKSQVVLGAFAKTKLLKPNESETVTLEFAVRDMASYDYNDANGNGFKGYELDAGIYNIYIGSDAHCWADANVLKKSYTLDAARFETDEVTGNNVENRFDAMSEQLLHEDRYPEDDANNEKDRYMSRADWAGTYPTLSYRLTAEQWLIDGLKKYNDVFDAPFGSEDPEDKPTDPWYNDVMPTTGANNNIKLNELFGLDYEDSKWDLFLDQLTVAQLTELAMHGPYTSGIDAPELGITVVHNEDRPNSIKIYGAASNVVLPYDVVTAATWNTELAYRRGNIIANIALWGNGSDPESRVPGWYAPAVNIHRNPFGGRVGEYFSEDGVLTGKLASAIVQGAQEKGLFCYVKHFALNSQETNRCGLITWASEQAMREVYFTPFEITVKEGKTIGMMSSLNRFGPRWAGGCYELLTEVLRNEWGFRGSVVTDMKGSWANADAMIRAGGSLMLGTGYLRVAPTSATTVNCLRNAAHDVLYAHANSMALNTGDTPTAPLKITAFSPKALDVAVVDTEYSVSVANCITLNTEYYPDLVMGDVTFRLIGSLPAGLELSEDGIISGTPTKDARVEFTIVATCGKESIRQDFTITVVGEGGAIIYAPIGTSFNGKIGKSLSVSVAQAEIYNPKATPEEIANFPDIIYTLANGSQLPEGLTLDEDGAITGLPTKECKDYAFTVVASAIGYSEVDCTFKISLLHDVAYGAIALEDGQFGKSYVAAVSTAECDVPVTYTLKEGSELPAGLTLTEKGFIVGTPAEACVKTFTVIASGKYTDSVEAEFTIKIRPTFDSMTELPNGKVGEAYFGSAGTAEGAFDISYELVAGALPSGLKLERDGTLSGTPEASGVYTFTVRARVGELTDDITLMLFVDNGGGLTTVIKGGVDKGLTMGVVGIVFGSIGFVLGGAALVLVLINMLKRSGNKPKPTATSGGASVSCDDGLGAAIVTERANTAAAESAVDEAAKAQKPETKSEAKPQKTKAPPVKRTPEERATEMEERAAQAEKRAVELKSKAKAIRERKKVKPGGG